MTFVLSSPPDFTEGIPFDLGQSATSTPGTDLSGLVGWDVAFGPYGFHMRPDEQHPYLRGTEQLRKQQIDTSDEAGEQTLGNWWRRSMATWDSGAGISWYEPQSDPLTKGRFNSSLGVDVWTAGQVSLLKAMSAVTAGVGSNAYVCTFDLAANDGWVEFRGERVRRFTSAGVATTAITVATGTLFTQPVTFGLRAWAGSNSGIWAFDPAAATITKIHTQTGTTLSRVFVAKSRLFITQGNKIYTMAPGAASGDLSTNGTLVYTHPDTNWVWTGLAEAGSAVLLSGYSGKDSAIVRFTVVDDGEGNPILGGGEIVQPMPNGEIITALGAYLGSSIVVGTGKGVRVGAMNSAGDVQLGPLTITTPTPVTSIIFRDRFAYVDYTQGHTDGGSGAARIDLSVPIGDAGRYAWAADARLPSSSTATVTSLALLGDQVVACTSTDTYQQSATVYESQGFLDTGKIRFSTTESKIFSKIRLTLATNEGSLILTAVDEGDVESALVTMDDSWVTSSDLPVTIPSRPLSQYLSFRAYLNRSSDTVGTPVLSSLVIKAQPAADRIRLFQYPISIYDNEYDRAGQAYASDAYSRLVALETAEATGAPVKVYDYRINETYIGQIDTVDFSSTNPADKTSSGFGGTALVVVRRLS